VNLTSSNGSVQASEQLRAVLQMLLSDLPSDLPVLFLGTSPVTAKELNEDALALFGRHFFEVRLPSSEARTKFFSKLIDSVFSVCNRKGADKPKQKETLPELPKAPKVNKGPSAAELQARAETEEHALRRLRMCLRDVCNRLLYEKRFSIFHYPVMADEAPDYRDIVHNPMDVATLLENVDQGHYLTRAAFLQDVELIPANAKAYNGDDYHGARIVSKACALRDAVHGMLSQMDPGLVAFCESIVAQGGPTQVPGAAPGAVNQVLALPVLRASARLRGFQPQSEVIKASECGGARRSRRSSEGLLLPGKGFA
jgi:hypothetical protein